MFPCCPPLPFCCCALQTVFLSPAAASILRGGGAPPPTPTPACMYTFISVIGMRGQANRLGHRAGRGRRLNKGEECGGCRWRSGLAQLAATPGSGHPVLPGRSDAQRITSAACLAGAHQNWQPLNSAESLSTYFAIEPHRLVSSGLFTTHSPLLRIMNASGGPRTPN